jgi:hypothetical protein
MRNLLFFSRVAFICNVCFALTWLMRCYPSLQQGQVTSTVLILGIAVAGILNILVSLAIIVLLVRSKRVWAHFPRWLIIINFLFLIPQLILFTR